ncbi:MAG: GIY-YIG nuclease family protein [Candidatus Doudnabacteria bacterium]|nr:GIY-YIG nuclease family protein [Candidatus Doudnabacteria bacterium]
MICWVYILQNENGRFYIGSSAYPENRVIEHNSGKTKSIKYGIPWRLVFKQQYSSREEAVQTELRLKNYKNKEIIKKIVQEQIILGP